MNNNHLTDSQLQDYLDSNPGLPSAVITHLENCPKCQHSLSNYRILVEALQQDPAFGLAPDFADRVIEQIPELQPVPIEKPATRFTLRDSVVMFAASILVLVGAIYFIDPAGIFAWLARRPSIPNPAGSSVVTATEQYMADLNIDPLFITFTIITILVIAAVDRIITHNRNRRKPVSFMI